MRDRGTSAHEGVPCPTSRPGCEEQAGILRRDRLSRAEHPREEVRVWIEPVARQLDEVIAIGDLYRFDRFAAPDALWDDLQRRFPTLLAASEGTDHGR
jgi:hypothetical protein